MLRTVSIHFRLVASGMIATLCVVITAAVGLFGVSHGKSSLDAQVLTTTAVHLAMQADMMHDAISGDVARAVLIGPDGPAEARNRLMQALARNTATLNAALADLQTLDLPQEQQGQLDALLPIIADYIASANETAALGRMDDVAAQNATSPFMSKFSRLETDLARFSDAIQAMGATISNHEQWLSNILIRVMLGVSVGATLLMMYNAWYLTRSITRPMERLRRALRDVADGDLGIRIGSITRDDDIGAIARDIDRVTDRIKAAMDDQSAMRAQGDHVIATLGVGLRNLSAGNLSAPIEEIFAASYEPLRTDFNDTVAKLSQLITQVVETCESIRARSSEISQSSESLASRTETQAATLQETAAALEEMTINVNTAAANAREVESVVLRARHDAEESGRVVQGAVAVMNEIDASSSQISQIIGVIDDIAFQTNLLALNAGVEAARAGDAGRGFAVVASEVRALAQRSSAAAKEIKTLISDSSQHVGRGVDQVGRAGEALASIVEKVAHISTLMSDMAQGASQQSTGLGEINIGVTQLDQVTQQNAAMVEESSDASHSLHREATTLAGLVGHFRLQPPSGALSHPGKGARSDRLRPVAQTDRQDRHTRASRSA